MAGLRSTVRDAAHRAFLTLTRGVLNKADDNHLLQEIDMDLYGNRKSEDYEQKTGIERMQQYGFTSVPKSSKPDDKKAAELLIAFVGSARSHGVVIAIDDRRYRLRNMKEGELALYDDQGQQIHISRDGVHVSVPHGKKISTRIMKKDDRPKPDKTDAYKEAKGDSKQNDEDGQSPQTKPEHEVHASFVLTKDSFTVMHPSKIVHQISDGDGKNVKSHHTLTPDGVTTTGKNLVENGSESVTVNTKPFTVNTTMAQVNGPSRHWAGPESD